MHWAARYIGKTQQEVGKCWGLMRLIYKDDFGIVLPEYPELLTAPLYVLRERIEAESNREWTRVDSPFDGCGVAMSIHDKPHHVGVYTSADGGRILHCYGKYNVIADTFTGLRLKGFRSVQLYRHKLWPTS